MLEQLVSCEQGSKPCRFCYRVRALPCSGIPSGTRQVKGFLVLSCLLDPGPPPPCIAVASCSFWSRLHSLHSAEDSCILSNLKNAVLLSGLKLQTVLLFSFWFPCMSTMLVEFGGHSNTGAKFTFRWCGSHYLQLPCLWEILFDFHLFHQLPNLSSLFLNFVLEYSWFTVLCQFMLCSK